MRNLIGRAAEIKELQRCVSSSRSEFVVVYGRRRVGKTYLVDSFFDCKYDFSYVGGHRLSKDKQLRGFARALKKTAKLDSQPRFKNWDDAFDALEEYLESLPSGRKKIVFIDEMPWIDTPQSDFVESLESFWNGWGARRDDIVFIATGSASSWMMDKIVENPGGLHARITSNIYVRPFTLKEVEEYLRSRGINWDRYQILQTYMVFGGVPFYLSLIDSNSSLVDNVNRLFFAKNGELRVEFDELYNAIFSNAGRYVDIVSLLNANHNGLTFEQIRRKTGVEGSRLTTILKNLQRCDFVISYRQFGNLTRGAIYRLSDFYTLFYYKFVHNNDSKDEQWWTRNFNSRSAESWQGYAFELICLTHIAQIRRSLGIDGISTNASSWRYVPLKSDDIASGAQIDLVIERADHNINLCEMKFCKTKYTISKDYENQVRRRIQLFKEKTMTNSSLISTFVTTYGITEGIHNSVVDVDLSSDILFES